MKKNINYLVKGEIIIKKIYQERDYEFVEKKGSGHPDTLADELAEELSKAFSNYTLKKFGVILHHNFDKLGILGGSSHVEFGKGYLNNPIRILVNGRVSVKFAGKSIPYISLIEKTIRKYFKYKFPMINLEKDIVIQYNLSDKSSPGKTDIISKKEGSRKYWFSPRNSNDLKETTFLGSNDTSMGVGFSPLSTFEKCILDLESKISNAKFKKDKPWLGSDIKIMGSKLKNEIDLTMCIPQICSFVKNEEEYKKNLLNMKKYVEKFIEARFPLSSVNLFINTRDNFETGELYLTAIGSSIESGDEGLVGRGNRTNGLISQTKPYTMEGASGKNPVYHIGKIYCIAAQKIADRINKKTNFYVEVFLISQSGRLLIDPWKTIIGINKDLSYKEIISLKKIIRRELNNIPKLTKGILKGRYRLS